MLEAEASAPKQRAIQPKWPAASSSAAASYLGVAREHSVYRQTIITANPELQEREPKAVTAGR